VTVPAADETLTVSYDHVASDAPNTCSQAPIQTSIGGWSPGTLGTSTDVDWYRFKIKSKTAMRIVLGNLPVAANLSLYSGCSSLLKTSARGGRSPEEIIRMLGAGTYALKVSGTGAFDPDNAYQLRVRSAGKYVSLLSSKTTIVGSQVQSVGEVLNASGSKRGPVTITAKLYDATGHLLATRSNYVYKPVLASLGRSAFKITGTIPAGFDHASLSVTSSPISHASIVAPWVHRVSGAPDGGGGWTTSGDVTNTGSRSMRSIRVFMTLYDPLNQVVAVGYVAPRSSRLAAHHSTTFSVHFNAVDPPSYTGVNSRGRR
jgi:hypothetical protein